MAKQSLIGNLAINLTLETAAFQEGATIAQKRMQKMQKSISKIGANMAKTGAAISAGITLPLVAFGKQAFQTAVDAQELQSAFNETFGDMSDEMNKWAVATGNAMSRSTREIQEGAQTFGLYFNQAAETRQEAAKMSQTFTILAQDLASMHNTGGEEAIAALRSGLSGESEPLRKFGVFLSEAAVQAKAAEMGIVGLGGKLTDQQKIMLRYNIIMEATKSAQGDVARTSGNTANQVKSFQAAMEELQITVGSKLLPALTPLITLLAGTLEKFNQLSPATQTWIVGIGAVGAALGPLMLGLSPLIAGVGALLPLIVKLGPLLGALGPIIMTLGRALVGLVIAGGPISIAIAAVGALYLAWKNWDKIEPIVRKLYEAVKTWVLDKLSVVWEKVKAGIKIVSDAFYALYDAVVGHSYIPDMVDEIGDHIRRLDGQMVNPALSATDRTAGAFSDMAQRVLGSIQSISGAIKSGNWLDALGGAFGAASGLGLFTPSTSKLMAPLKSTSSLLSGLPGFSTGGSFRVGGKGGIDQNLIAFRATKGEMVDVRRPGENERTASVTIIPTPYFNAVVKGQAVEVAAPLAQAGAVGGAAMAQQNFSRASRNRIP